MSTSIRQKLCVAALLAFAVSAHAETKASCPPPAAKPTPEKVQAAQQSARDHGFLWRIGKDGRTSYLYGTMHIAKFEWMFPGPEVTKALRATDTIALELDVLDPDIKGRMGKSMKALRNTVLPEPLAKRVRKLAESVCVPYEAIVHLTPELQLATLAMLMGRADGLEPAYAIDASLAAIGHGTNRNVVSLETPESQLEQLQMPTPEETIAAVQDDLDQLEKENGHIYFERVANIWGDSDYAEMSRFEEWCDCLDTELERKMMKRLLDDRNPKLAERIDELHKSGKQVFAAVGSLHMFGSLALPALMEKLGYKVARVDLKPL